MKSKLRIEFLKKRRDYYCDELIKKSKEIKKRLFNLDCYKKARNIMFYVSFDNEVNTHEMIKEALKDKIVVVPITNVKEKKLELSEIRNFDLKPNIFGVLEPIKKIEFDKDKLDLVIVPGIVFDEKGHRIGYGYGYYDRFLKTLRKDTLIIGLAYEFQIIKDIPAEKHDIKVDMVVSEKRVLRC